MSHYYHEIPLEIHPHQIVKLVKGHVIQLPHSSIMPLHVQTIPIVVKKHKHTKIMRAHRGRKGVRLHLDPEELEMQGSGFWDTLKSIGSFIKDKVFTNPVYKQTVAPLLKQGLNSGVDFLASKVPVAGPLLGDLAHQGVNKLGEVSGAYGLRDVSRLPRRVSGKRSRGHGGAVLLPEHLNGSVPVTSFSVYGGPLNPQLPRRDFSMADVSLPDREADMPSSKMPMASLTKGRFAKGSAEAKEWSKRMMAAKAAKRGETKGGSFQAAGY